MAAVRKPAAPDHATPMVRCAKRVRSGYTRKLCGVWRCLSRGRHAVSQQHLDLCPVQTGVHSEAERRCEGWQTERMTPRTDAGNAPGRGVAGPLRQMQHPGQRREIASQSLLASPGTLSADLAESVDLPDR